MIIREYIAIGIGAAVLIIDLVTDYQLWLKYRNEVKPEGSVKHKYGFWLRVAGLAPAMILGRWFLSPVIGFLYWHLFDGLYNLLTGENWFRIGTTAGTDTAQRKYPVITWLKYIGLIGSIIFFILCN